MTGTLFTTDGITQAKPLGLRWSPEPEVIFNAFCRR